MAAKGARTCPRNQGYTSAHAAHSYSWHAGRFVFEKEVPFYDPNNDNLVSYVSTRQVSQEGEGDTTIVLIDCGAKRNIARRLLARNVRVITVPWDWNPFTDGVGMDFDGIVVSNGLAILKMAQKTIATIRSAMSESADVGYLSRSSVALALAAGGDTYKLKFGHRSQNRPHIARDETVLYHDAKSWFCGW